MPWRVGIGTRSLLLGRIHLLLQQVQALAELLHRLRLQRRQQLTQTFSWQDLWHDEHAQQFTVSRLARNDLLKALQDGITKSVQGNLSRRDWVRNAKALLQKEGWWGEKEVLDPVTGGLAQPAPLAYAALALPLVFTGAGRLSIDHALGADRRVRLAERRASRDRARHPR